MVIIISYFIAAVKLSIIIILLFGGSLQDIFFREVSNWVPGMILIVSFVGFEPNKLKPMLFGMIVTSLPLFLAAIIKTNSIGGADIKIMAAAGLLLGAKHGITALIIGMLAATLCTISYRVATHNDLKKSFPLIPYLSLGIIISYFLRN